MIIKNCAASQLKEVFDGKKLIAWGAGKGLINVSNELKDATPRIEIAYIVDTSPKGEVEIMGKNIPIYSPEKLKQESGCTILVTSSKYMIEIYEMLENMNLSDSVECYFWAFIQLMQPQELLEKGRLALINEKKELIPRVIHTFWFSGEPLPDEYNRCLDSWKKYCPDYDIIIWDQSTYDCSRNQFVADAISERKWAFATDVARLETLYKYGGVYMDLDVEIYRPLDDLLCHKGVFFHLHDCIDLPVFSSVKGNQLIKSLWDHYNDAIFSKDETIQKTKLVQPRMVKPVFENEGVPMEEGVHLINQNLYLPRNMFLPNYWFDWSGVTKCNEAGYGIHHCNAGWYTNESKEERNRKIESIRKIWNRISW